MAIGKNKKLGKKRKGGKKVVDPFTKKDWFDVRAPSLFPKQFVGRTIATRSSGNRSSRDSLLGRVFEVSLGDLKEDGDAFRMFKLRALEVQGKQVLTNFCGMRLTTDKLKSMVRKNQTLIEAAVDVKTTDGYSLRVFCIGFTRPKPRMYGVPQKASHAQTSQVKQIRLRMISVIQRETSCDLQSLVEKLIPGSIGKEVERAAAGVYPLVDVMIRKVKVLRAPKVDVGKLLELHGGADKGKKVKRVEEETPAEEE